MYLNIKKRSIILIFFLFGKDATNKLTAVEAFESIQGSTSLNL